MPHLRDSYTGVNWNFFNYLRSLFFLLLVILTFFLLLVISTFFIIARYPTPHPHKKANVYCIIFEYNKSDFYPSFLLLLLLNQINQTHR